RRIAGILARLGLKGSRSSVQRIFRRPPKRPAKKDRVSRPLPRAKAPRHMYVIDFTVLRGMFRSVVVGAVMDLFSRRVLAIRVSPQEPDAAFAVSLLRTAVRRNGKPRWIVSDRGRQFSSRLFGALLKRRRIRRRWGPVGRPGAPTLDRWWRTLKEEYARGLMLYLPIASLERKLSGYAAWYNVERPNSGLCLRTPEEIFRGTPARKKRRVEAGKLVVALMGGDRRLPVFRLRRAA
ncbi:MAG: DDE-type integrase/transposase/recombinase, partial [Vicinamibacteria bacterium]